MGGLAARSMLGQQDRRRPRPYFHSDQYDLGMEYVGYVTSNDYGSVVFHGNSSIVDGEASAVRRILGKDRRVLAAMNANIWDVQPDLQKIVRAGRRRPKTVDLVRPR